MMKMALPLLMMLLLAPATAEQETAAQDKLKCPTCESCEPQLKKLAKLEGQLEAARGGTGKLEAQLEALRKENAQLKQQIPIPTAASNGEVPYLSTKAIVDSLGSATDFAISKVGTKGSLDQVNLAPVYTAANACQANLQVASKQATEAASKGLAAATEALYSTTKLAQDLHGKHVSQHTREYYDTTVETYTAHLEPHVSTARKAYYDNLHPHVGKASETIYAGYGVALESGKTISPKLWDFVKLGQQMWSKGSFRKDLGFLVEHKDFKVMGKKFSFEHGFLDMALAAVQGLVASYVAFTILWKLCLNTLVWKIGVKILGRKVCIGIIGRLIKACFKATRLILSVSFTVVLTLVALAFSWVLMAICSGLGIALLHAVEKNLAVGLKPGMRLGAGAGIGMMFYLLCRCKFCKRRQAAKSKSAPAKTEAKKVMKTDAKQAPAKPKDNKKK